MKRGLKKGLLLALCILCALFMSGCYADNDPWPSADELAGSEATMPPTATALPATDAPTVQPHATVEPLPEDAVDVSTNFNG